MRDGVADGDTGHGAVVVVVDDDEAVMTFMRSLLDEEGYRTVSWSRGEGAYQFIREQRPHLVVLDVWMERRDTGWLLLDRLRAHPDTRDLPVLVCSADSAGLRERAASLADARAAVMEKPFDIPEFLGAVRRLTGGDGA